MSLLILTFLSAISLSAISAYFSILGLLAIFPTTVIPILIMGICIELAKMVATVWLKVNWKRSPLLIKFYLLLSVTILMVLTSIGSFGYLSKAHIEQNATVTDNSPKIERIVQQISHEQQLIEDNNKLISQLDTVVNSFIGKDNADKAIAVRKAQQSQRKQLKDSSSEIYKTIEKLNEEKFKLESELRQIQLDVGPIRYIAELMYGENNSNIHTLESAVKIFILLIVLTLDPLAIVLLIAANHSLMLRREKQTEIQKKQEIVEESAPIISTIPVVQPLQTDTDNTYNTVMQNNMTENFTNTGVVENTTPVVDEPVVIHKSTVTHNEEHILDNQDLHNLDSNNIAMDKGVVTHTKDHDLLDDLDFNDSVVDEIVQTEIDFLKKHAVDTHSNNVDVYDQDWHEYEKQMGLLITELVVPDSDDEQTSKNIENNVSVVEEVVQDITVEANIEPLLNVPIDSLKENKEPWVTHPSVLHGIVNVNESSMPISVQPKLNISEPENSNPSSWISNFNKS